MLFGRHEIDQRDGPRRRFEQRFEDHRPGPVMPADLGRRMARSDSPAAVVRRAKECGEAGRAVETRPAKPVNGPRLADQCRGAAVANQGVVFDGGRLGWCAPVQALVARPGVLFDGGMDEAADGPWPSVRPSPHVLPAVTQAVTAPAGRDRTIHRAHIGAGVAHLPSTRVCRGIGLRRRIHHGGGGG